MQQFIDEPEEGEQEQAADQNYVGAPMENQNAKKDHTETKEYIASRAKELCEKYGESVFSTRKSHPEDYIPGKDIQEENYPLWYKCRKDADDWILGKKTSAQIKISEVSSHAIDQMMGRTASIEQILDTIQYPGRVEPQLRKGEKRFKFLKGIKMVIVTPYGRIVTAFTPRQGGKFESGDSIEIVKKLDI